MNERTAVRSEKTGGWCRLEDFCDRTEHGSGVTYTSGITDAADELAFIEQGPRVSNAIIDKDVMGWDALMDRLYEHEMSKGS